jgi:uncharacterized membrane protein YfcA
MGNKDIVRINAIKSITGFFVIAISSVVFISQGLIDWRIAALFTMGTIIGGALGGYFQIKKGNKTVQLLVALIALILACKLIFT